MTDFIVGIQDLTAAAYSAWLGIYFQNTRSCSHMKHGGLYEHGGIDAPTHLARSYTTPRTFCVTFLRYAFLIIFTSRVFLVFFSFWTSIQGEEDLLGIRK